MAGMVAQLIKDSNHELCTKKQDQGFIIEKNPDKGTLWINYARHQISAQKDWN